ncbi:hypothetical protein [Lentzea terrae]|uniref:hypothetical protein n=1 Tax=Lentzea terrae TaxID=2200761 RepID=UPI000DD44115|nr:hypothetical protein [Lentzea terrae]
MSETPTHAAVPTPTPARPLPQQTERQAEERTPPTDRMPQQQPPQHAEQRTDQRADQRPDQRSDQRADQRSEQRAEQRTEHQRGEQQRTEQPTGQRPSSKLEDEWQSVQYEFVDDPKAAVRKADDLVKRAIEELTTRHRSLTQQLEGNGDPQTEDLRLALHRYRELFKSLVAVK